MRFNSIFSGSGFPNLLYLQLWHPLLHFLLWAPHPIVSPAQAKFHNLHLDQSADGIGATKLSLLSLNYAACGPIESSPEIRLSLKLEWNPISVFNNALLQSEKHQIIQISKMYNLHQLKILFDVNRNRNHFRFTFRKKYVDNIYNSFYMRGESRAICRLIVLSSLDGLIKFYINCHMTKFPKCRYCFQ